MYIIIFQVCVSSRWELETCSSLLLELLHALEEEKNGEEEEEDGKGGEDGEVEGGEKKEDGGKDIREGSIWWRDVQTLVENVLGKHIICFFFKLNMRIYNYYCLIFKLN